jgi:hypothetical protein
MTSASPLFFPPILSPNLNSTDLQASLQRQRVREGDLDRRMALLRLQLDEVAAHQQKLAAAAATQRDVGLGMSAHDHEWDRRLLEQAGAENLALTAELVAVKALANTWEATCAGLTRRLHQEERRAPESTDVASAARMATPAPAPATVTVHHVLPSEEALIAPFSPKATMLFPLAVGAQNLMDTAHPNDDDDDDDDDGDGDDDDANDNDGDGECLACPQREPSPQDNHPNPPPLAVRDETAMALRVWYGCAALVCFVLFLSSVGQ